MAEAVVHQSQQRDADQDARRELEPGAAPANSQPPEHAGEDTGNDLSDAIALRRLLAVATLTPAQAGLLAVDLVDTLVTLEERGECPEQVNDRSVLLRRDGTVMIAPSAETPPSTEAQATPAKSAAGTAAATASNGHAANGATTTGGANDTGSGAATESTEDSGGDDAGGRTSGGTTTSGAGSKRRSTSGKGKTRTTTGDRARSTTKNGTTNAAERGRNGAARTTERDAEGLPVAATMANSLVRQLVSHTRGGSARRKVDAALLTDRLAGTCTELTELRDKVRGAAAELAAGDGTEWDDWTVSTRRQLTALVTATVGRVAPKQSAQRGGHAPHDDSTADTDTAATPPSAAPGPAEQATPASGASGALGTPGTPGTPETPTSSSTLSLARGDLRGARRKAWHRKRRLPRRKAVAITLVVALIVAAGWWAVPRAWSELRRGWEAVFTTSEPSQQLPPVVPPQDESSGGNTTGMATDDPEPAPDEDKPAAVPRLAPKEAAPITGVTIERAEGECTRGEVCPVRVDVMLDPSASPREVGWSLRMVDRCTGKIRKREGVTMTAAAGWGQVYGISRPTLSDSRALAIVAVTNTPAKAASAPLLVSANRALC